MLTMIILQGGGTNGVVEISLWLVRVLCNVSVNTVCDDDNNEEKTFTS